MLIVFDNHFSQMLKVMAFGLTLHVNVTLWAFGRMERTPAWIWIILKEKYFPCLTFGWESDFSSYAIFFPIYSWIQVRIWGYKIALWFEGLCYNFILLSITWITMIWFCVTSYKKCCINFMFLTILLKIATVLCISGFKDNWGGTSWVWRKL